MPFKKFFARKIKEEHSILFLHLASPCRWLSERELSLPKAYKQFKTFALLFLQALASSYLLKKFIASLHLQFESALKDKKTPKKISSYQQIELLHLMSSST